MPNPPASLYLAPGVLQRLDGGTFFYPSAGADFRVPLALFAPVLADFWFVDRGYFTPGHEDTRHDGLDLPIGQAPPLLAGKHEYRLLHRAVEEPAWRSAGFDRLESPQMRRRREGVAASKPLLLTEHYLHLPSGRNVRLHRCRGDAMDCFEGEARLARLGVFFYRGDSAGEGGSGICWLSDRLECAVLERLKPGGLFVADGSDGTMCPDDNPSEFRRGQRTRINPARDIARVVAGIRPIEGADGTRLRCVGYAGERYGSTLAWQVPADATGLGSPARDGLQAHRGPRPLQGWHGDEHPMCSVGWRDPSPCLLHAFDEEE